MNLEQLLIPYLLKPGTNRNEPKPAKTKRNQSKPAETTPKNCETIRIDSKLQKWGNLEFSASFRFSNIESKCLNLGILGQKILTF